MGRRAAFVLTNKPPADSNLGIRVFGNWFCTIVRKDTKAAFFIIVGRAKGGAAKAFLHTKLRKPPFIYPKLPLTNSKPAGKPRTKLKAYNPEQIFPGSFPKSKKQISVSRRSFACLFGGELPFLPCKHDKKAHRMRSCRHNPRKRIGEEKHCQ